MKATALMANKINPTSTTKTIKTLSLYLGITTLLLSYLLRTSLSLEGDTASSSIVSNYGSALIVLVVGLHAVAALMLFPQLKERLDNSREILITIGVHPENEPTRGQRISARFAGISIPVLMGLAFYAWITVMQIPHNLVSSHESNILYNTLFLLQIFYINWEFARHKLKRMEMNGLNKENITELQEPVDDQ